ncbi:DUF4352 domain-containing protein [Streptomyces poriticola]|uniref:DUF4352 domain-containing protein n=1 Tax=Streptomyces poriticola TaxID=3120506 RepID=UPI002FCE4636
MSTTRTASGGATSNRPGADGTGIRETSTHGRRSRPFERTGGSSLRPVWLTTGGPQAEASPERYQLGDTVDISAGGNDFSAAALAFEDKGITGGPGLLSEGQKWAVVEVKVCNKGDEAIQVGPFVWTLAYADGARMEPTHTSGGALPQPLYPLEAKVRGGDCVRGKVTFQVPEQGRAERVLYSPTDLDEPVEWAVPKA